MGAYQKKAHLARYRVNSETWILDRADVVSFDDHVMHDMHVNMYARSVLRSVELQRGRVNYGVDPYVRGR